MPSDLLLAGGTVVSPSDSCEADLIIRDGRIAAIGQGLPSSAETLDVSGCLVLPGGIDTHVHLEHPIERLGIVTADDFESGTTAAACGGVTSIIDFALQRKGESLRQAVDRRRDQAEGKAVIDFGLHIIVTDVTEEVLSEMPGVTAEGYTSFKMFMTYRDKVVDDQSLLKVMEQAAASGGLTYVHCENDGAVRHLTQSLLDGGRRQALYHAKSRPPRVEAEAVHRAIALAAIAGAPVVIAHVSSEEALQPIIAARRRSSLVFGETCPQYLTLSERLYEQGPEATKFVCTPPLRAEHHQQTLWEALRRGDIQQVSSDHAPFRYRDQKLPAKDDFTSIPNGLPGIETRLPLLFSEGVAKGRISVHRFVELTAANPAKIFGLYPRKGSLSLGADADIVVIDPEKEAVIDHRSQHSRVDYSPYQGMKLKGVPVLTLSRGEVIARDGEPSVKRGRGRFLARKQEEKRRWPSFDCSTSASS